MGFLKDSVYLNLLIHGDNIYDNFKNNSLFFYNKYKESDNDVKNIPIDDITIGRFYFFHYADDSNWMKYAPVFVIDYRKFSNMIIIFAINLNFIPLEIRIDYFDKLISKDDIIKDLNINVNYQKIYNSLRSIGYEYSINEFNAAHILMVHRISMNIVPRFLISQHPVNKYDPKALFNIWKKKIENRDKRDKEIMNSIIKEFYDINADITNKYDVLQEHIKRIRKNYIKYSNKNPNNNNE